MIPYGRQEITAADVEAVVAVLRSDYLTQGPEVELFESAVCGHVGARFGFAMNSATSALHVACLALELGPGDVLWTVPNTFVASANCARYCGAEVDFVDIDPDSWNISIPALTAKLRRAHRDGRLPKVLVPVHFAGQPTNQEAIHELGKEYGFRIIEDASHAIGASRHGERVGSCRWSDITVFSFHPVKIITTGEGGMAVTNDGELAGRMALLRSHGITRDPRRFEDRGRAGLADGADRDPAAWYYEQQRLGFNYRITDIQAALGRSQLTRLEEYVARRNELAREYQRALSSLRLQLPFVDPANRSAFHLYVVRVRPDARRTRRSVFDRLRAGGVGANVHYLPVHLQPYFRGLGFRPGQFPEAEAHGETAITLPLFPAMSASDQQHVIETLARALDG